MIGTTLSHFRITSKLGEGGMGEVYRAEDTRLGREVAIKVLPAAVSGDPERLARFEREAKVLASLNHPHVATIHQVEEDDGIHFLVMELAAGEDLKDRIAHGPIDPDDARKIALQVAEALEAAHERGIIHRDLKPGNIKVGEDGDVKVLDFGLAKALDATGTGSDRDQSQSPLSLSPTLTAQMTGAGVLLGTAGYMSPEQARGKQADHRSDIWSFGVVLWEMLTGEQLFAGETVSDSLAAVLRKEPDLDKVPAATPWSLRYLLEQCLQRDPRQRLQHVGDARLALTTTFNPVSEIAQEQVEASSSRMPAWLPWALAGVLGLAAAAGFLRPGVKAPARATPVVRASINPPEHMEFEFLGENAGPVVVSPDGEKVAFVARERGKLRTLWVRRLDASEAQVLTGTEGASRPFWSPDSQHLGFFADGKLKRVEFTGGSPLSLAAADSPRGGTWNEGGVIVFSPTFTGPLFRVSAAGGDVRQITELDESRHEITHRYPYFLPDGEHLIFLARSTGAGSEHEPAILLTDLEGAERRPLLPGVSDAIFASGYLLYVRETALMAQPFDLQRLELTGEPSRVVDGVQFDRRYSRGVFSASTTGVLAFQEGEGFQESELLWVDRQGEPISRLGVASLYDDVRLSPDGGRAATVIMDPATGLGDVWVLDRGSGLQNRFTFSPEDEASPVWSADGKRLLFVRNQPGVASQILIRDASGAGAETLVTELNFNLFPTSWSPDGRYLLGYSYAGQSEGGAGGQETWLLDLEGDAQPTPFAQTPSNDANPRFSPDGRWVAFESDSSGVTQVYIAPFPDTGSRWQVSRSDGFEPIWRGDGKELFFVTLDGVVTAAAIGTAGGAIQVGALEPLFPADLAAAKRYRIMVDPNGSSFLINSSLSRQRTTPLTLVLNWTEIVAPTP